MDAKDVVNMMLRHGRLIADHAESSLDPETVNGLAALRDSPAALAWIETLAAAPELPPGVLAQTECPADVQEELLQRNFDFGRLLPLIQFVMQFIRQYFGGLQPTS